MSEEKRLLEQIEALRKKMEEIYLRDGMSPDVLGISHELDQLLNQYNRLKQPNFDSECRRNIRPPEDRKMLYNIRRKQLGERLGELMEEKRMTRRNMAERTGISRSYISLILAGKGNPCFAKLVALAHALEVELHELFLEKEGK